jgi:DNA-binding CsgD family transcriptional regulator
VEAAAASVAARGAPEAGIRLAQLAVDLTPGDRRAALHKRRLDCARYAFAAGDPKHATVLLVRQLEAASAGRERAEVELELGRAELATRGISTATEHFQRALREAEGTDELELQAVILTELADMHLGDLRTDTETSARAVSLAEKVWNPQLLARALALHGATLSASGRPPGEDYWERAMRIEREAGDLRYGGPAYQYGIELFLRGEFEVATAHLGRVADSMRARSDPMLPRVLLHLSDLRRASGSWESAAEHLRQAHAVVVETGHESLEPECILYEARFAMLRGDLDRAADLIEEALVLLEELAAVEGRRAAFDGTMMEVFARSLRGRIASFSGRHAEAHELFLEDVESLRQLGLRELLVEALVEDITTLVALGELDEARQSLHELGELTPALGKPWLDALEARARGLVASADGDLTSALHHLERSRDLLDSLPSPWPYELARTLFWLGTVQRRTRRKQAARSSFDRALQLFEHLGAGLWSEKTRAELPRIGGRPSQTSALTATERRIAEVVATGRSNAEVAQVLFISPKTVEWNLSKIYKKLHVRSRTELAAKLAKQTIHS